MTARILIVDDDPSIMLAVRDELIFEGFEVDSATDGPGSLVKAREFRPDVMLLDLELPGLNGFEVCRRLRSEMPDLWIIIISVRHQEADRVRGFEIGADDYVTKGFSLRELVARVKVGLRRRAGKAENPIHKFGDIEIDLRSHRVQKKNREILLTPKEFEILQLLVERAGEVITRDDFLNTIWGEDFSISPRVIDTHIAALRKKIEDDPNECGYIVGVHGFGYKLNQILTKA